LTQTGPLQKPILEASGKNVADIALLVVGNEDAIDATLEQSSEVGPAEREPLRALILTVAGEEIERFRRFRV
jgi:hypothetical protein